MSAREFLGDQTKLAVETSQGPCQVGQPRFRKRLSQAAQNQVPQLSNALLASTRDPKARNSRGIDVLSGALVEVRMKRSLQATLRKYALLQYVLCDLRVQVIKPAQCPPQTSP